MITVNFNKNGGPLTAKAVFLGDMVADYGMYLKAIKGNDQELLLEGDNLNDENDSKQLPGTTISISGRKLKLETVYYGNHPDLKSDYEIRLEV